MLIVVDGTSPVAGAGLTWVEEMVPALCSKAPDDRILLVMRSNMTMLSGFSAPNLRVERISFPRVGALGWRLAWQQTLLPRFLKQSGAQVVISPFDVAPMIAPCPVILGIQNASPHMGPRSLVLSGRARLFVLGILTKLAASRASMVFFVSEWSRREIAGILGLPADKTVVIPCGVSGRFRSLVDRSQPPPARAGSSNPSSDRLAPSSRDLRETVDDPEESVPYVLSVGSFGPHKDYDTLIEAWARLRSMQGERVVLRMVGHVLESVYCRGLVDRISALGLGDDIRLEGPKSLDEVVSFYRGARACVLASQIETFGIPMIEAMMCGVPVVASDIPVAREVSGDAALYYRVGDASDLAEKLKTLLTDVVTRDRLIGQGKIRSAAFSWERSADRLLDLAHRVVDQGPKSSI